MLPRLNSLLNSPRVQRISDRLALAWYRLRQRFRHNPGFVTAALAGTLGLILAIVLLFRGGYNMLVTSHDSTNSPTDKTEQLNAPDIVESRPNADDNEGEHFSLHHTAQSEPAVEDDDEPEPRPLQFLAQSKREAPARKSSAASFSDDEPSEAETIRPADKPHAKTAAAPNISWADEPDEPEPAKPEPPTVVHASDGQTGRHAVKPTTQPVPKRVTSADDEPAVETDDSNDQTQADESQLVAAEDDSEPEPDPVASTQPSLQTAQIPVASQSPRWGKAKSRTVPRAEVAPASAELSRSVETVIYSAPGSPASEADSAIDFVAPQRTRMDGTIRLQIQAPSRGAARESVVLDFRVTNTGTQTVQNLSLSVELPPGLTHREGRMLEHVIDRIKPGETRPARLTVYAAATGLQTLRSNVTLAGTRLAETETAIEIGASRQAAAADCCGVPIR